MRTHSCLYECLTVFHHGNRKILLASRQPARILLLFQKLDHFVLVANDTIIADRSVHKRIIAVGLSAFHATFRDLQKSTAVNFCQT